jgi:hypothetical protein
LALKPCLHKAIEVIEGLQLSGRERATRRRGSKSVVVAKGADAIRTELQAGTTPNASTHTRFLIRLLQYLAIERHFCTAVYCHRNPVTVAVELLLAEGRTPLESALKGFFTERNCRDLVAAARRVASSPLLFCDARQSIHIDRSIAALGFRYQVELVITDWELAGIHLERIGKLTSASRLKAISISSLDA